MTARERSEPMPSGAGGSPVARPLPSLCSGPVIPLQHDVTIVDLLLAHARRHPSATALVARSGPVPFSELERQVESIAGAVTAAGVPHGGVVGLAAERSAEAAAALFGVLRAAATVVPLDLGHPPRRLQTMLDAAHASLVIADARGSEVLAEGPQRMLSLQAALRSTERAETRPRDRDGAYVIFTSGSTGEPKGVLVEHRGLANLYAHHCRELYPLAAAGRTLRVALTSSFAFDAAWDQLLWMIAGHEVHVVEDRTRRDSQALLDLIQHEHIDVVNVTPSQAQVLVELGLLEGSFVPSVLVLGGEAVGAVLWERLAAASDVLTFNLYGPTETTIDALGWPIAAGSEPLIGLPIANTSVAIVDAADEVVPRGTIGEIVLSGANVARGYVNTIRETAERFTPDPHSPIPASRRYRTGDVGRMRADGAVEFIGRADQQVKIRGYRVEIAEVEQALRAHTDVSDVAVVFDTAGRDPRLIAYVVARSGLVTPLDGAVLRDHAAALLPDYMVPQATVFLDDVPRLVSGKVDAGRLPAPVAQSPAPAAQPRAGVEAVVAQAMAEVLEVEAVGRDDDFFAEGGHSLLAVRFVARVRAELGVDVPLRALFDNATVAGFAAAVDRELAKPGGANAE